MPHSVTGMWHSGVMAHLPHLIVVDNGTRSYYKMCARNGQTMLTSETYKTPRNAERAARKVADQLGLRVTVRVVKSAAAV